MTAGGRRGRTATSVVRWALLIVGAAIMVVPFLYMLSTSFTGQAYVLTIPPQFIPNPPTLDNYAQALSTQDFARYFLNSAVVSVIATAAAVLLSSMMAYGFARFDFPGKEWVFRLLLIGLVVPAMMLIIPQFLLAKSFGLVDTLAGLIVFYVAGNLAFNTFLLRGFFATLPSELDQAMQMDGANVWTRYWRLAMPLARPALGTVTIFTFLSCWDEFAWALTLIQTPENSTLPLALSLFQGQNSTLWGLVFAGSVIAVVPVIVVFLVFQRSFVQGLTTGAVKG
ncbi:carbohydrate ABC transporter permease [Mesorhizobium japonicum]|uniref:carbohydrate ABC transporter permease n=1 Tax=Mesorhizobium japonicum TaxID=2066070 RepID=UPI003B595F15